MKPMEVSHLNIITVMTKQKPKRIPYGMMNYVAVREDNCYYVDKTRFIERIEDANKFFLLFRPRRFGKSLTLSMLQHYYDINQKQNFDKLYGDLYIGSHPTPERNSYLVIRLNFALVDATLGNYRSSLDAHCENVFRSFCVRYASLLPSDALERLLSLDGCVKQLEYICQISADSGHKIYLFIDEYDNFTNSILSDASRMDEYRGETHGTGYLRTFFNAIKDGTESSIGRVFITGVSPVTLDDLTSGFNIGTNYTLSPSFNEMVGFTEQEVREMLEYYSSVYEFRHSIDELLDIMRPWYDNYCFAEEAYGITSMYNSNMVLYFIDKYKRSHFNIPSNLIEDNIRDDYNKLRMLIRKDKEFAHDASVIQTIVNQGYINGELKQGFPAEKIADEENFISLLYYFGLLTIGGQRRGKTCLVIPNEVVREQMYTYLLDNYRENNLDADSRKLATLCEEMAYTGTWRPFFEYIAESIYTFSSQRDRQKGEAFVHGYTLALTSQCHYYRPISELDNQTGYADIYLCPRQEVFTDMQHSYIIELKYLRRDVPDSQLPAVVEKAREQICRYAESETVRSSVRQTTLHRLVIVYRGVEMVACEEIHDA